MPKRDSESLCGNENGEIPCMRKCFEPNERPESQQCAPARSAGRQANNSRCQCGGTNGQRSVSSPFKRTHLPAVTECTPGNTTPPQMASFPESKRSPNSNQCKCGSVCDCEAGCPCGGNKKNRNTERPTNGRQSTPQQCECGSKNKNCGNRMPADW